MMRRLFPTLAQLEPIELATLPIGIVMFVAPLSQIIKALMGWP